MALRLSQEKKANAIGRRDDVASASSSWEFLTVWWLNQNIMSRKKFLLFDPAWNRYLLLLMLERELH